MVDAETLVRQAMTCGVRTFFGPCPFPATAHVVMGCVHEHLRAGPMCDAHAAESAAPGDSGGDCRACFDGARSHGCPLTFISAGPLAAVS